MTRLRTLRQATAGIRPLSWQLVGIALLITLFSPGCMHRIEVHPAPSQAALAHIPKSAQVTLTALTIEGADHMPGITWLEWRPKQLEQALLDYVRQRGTFASVSTNPAPLALKITAKLAMLSRAGRYRYVVAMHAELAGEGLPIKTYDTEGTADGSRVRWVTDSDRAPIEAALQAALDKLLASIEADRALYASHPSVEPRGQGISQHSKDQNS